MSGKCLRILENLSIGTIYDMSLFNHTALVIGDNNFILMNVATGEKLNSGLSKLEFNSLCCNFVYNNHNKETLIVLSGNSEHSIVFDVSSLIWN